MKIRRLASSHGVGPSLWKSQMAALGPTPGIAEHRPIALLNDQSLAARAANQANDFDTAAGGCVY
jgi:hypothetical protein